jgi:chromosome segregation ATPase
MLEDIKANLEASIDDEHNTNTTAIDDYDELLAAMEHTLNDLLVAKAQLEEDELRLQAEIGAQEERLAQNTDELNAATAEKNAKIVQCNEWSQKYIADTKKRSEELDIVAATKDIFVNQLGDMSDYLSDRVEY